MDYALDRFAQQARDAVLATGKAPTALVELVEPKAGIPADLALPAFRAARELGVPPPKLAQELATALRLPENGLVARAVAAGPFLNFALDPARLAAAVLEEVERGGERYGADDLGAGKTIVIDYSAPNIAKTMHVGHIRSTIIGQALYNIFSFLGYRTIGDNHLGDWGTQFGMNIAAIVRWGKPEGAGEEAIAAIDKLYADYNRLVREEQERGETALADEARSWSVRLERGDPTARELWQWMVDLTMQANQPNYDRLGVRFDHTYGESFYAPMSEAMIDEALGKKVAHRDEAGAVVVEEIEPNLPTFLLQRSDTGTLYHTRDIACIRFRLAEFHPEKIIYVVDARQELHFRQLFALARAMGYDDAELVHIKFGTIFDAKGQPLSTRKGNMIYLADLFGEAHARAKAVVDQASPELPEPEREQIAEAVGIGAVVYNDLYQDPRRNITLDWERMLSIVGNSAPYIQYMHARCRSILRKAVEETTGDRRPTADDGDVVGGPWSAGDAGLLTHPAEAAVVKQIAKLPLATREAGERYAPSVVAEWCYDTARAMSGFYEHCSVLKAETPELRGARLRLVAATAQALKNGLALLNIRAPERM